MKRTLIVARMDAADAPAVAAAFARSDRTDLPRMVGAHGRALFHFRGLYLHLVESWDDVDASLGAVRDHPLYTTLDAELSRHVSAYASDWRRPRDAMATCFYQWRSPDGPQPPTAAGEVAR